MSKKSKQYSSKFKAKIFFAAIQREKTILQLASSYGIHPRRKSLVENGTWSTSYQFFPTAIALVKIMNIMLMTCIA